MKNNVILAFICLLPFFSIAAQSSSVVDTNSIYKQSRHVRKSFVNTPVF